MSAFVGRHRELAELDTLIAGMAVGAGGSALISGEAGIGKTRLCEELADRAAARGVTVAWARCWEGGGAPPFWPWEQLARQFEKNGNAPLAAVASTDDPDLSRMRFFDDAAQRVRAVAAVRPLLLIVDDVHWADVGSVLLLTYLASSLRGAACVILLTCRDGEAEPGTALGDAIVGLARAGRRISLSGLDPADLPELVRWLTAGAGTLDTDADALHHLTGGNPLFAQEVVRLAAAQGRARPLATGTVAAVPDTVRGVLARRLGQLSPDCRTLLETGAVMGEVFSLGLLREVTGLPADRLLEVVGEGLAAHVVREAGVAEYAFAHPLVRATLYDELGVARRVRLHEQVGLALERRRAAGHHADLAVLAHHFVAAAAGGGAAKAAAYAVEAAESAMRRFGYENAVDLYERALRALDLDPSAADRCDVLLGLGGAQMAAGSRTAARGTYLRAVGLAREGGRPEDLARAALGLAGGGGFEVALADRQQIDLLEEARTALGPTPSALAALVAARLSVALSLSGADERRLALSEEAVAAARGSADRSALAYALSAHCDAIAGPAETMRRLQESTEIIELAAAIGDGGMELLGRRLRVVALFELGDTTAVDVEIDAYARLAEVIRQPLYAWYVPLWRGTRALMRGDLATCLRHADEAAAVGARAESDNARILCEALRWYEGRESGRTGEPEWFAEFLQMEHVFGTQVRVSVTLMLADAGRLDEVRARLDADAGAIRLLPADSEWISSLVQVAQAIAEIGGHDLAAWVYDALLPHRRLFGVEGIGAAWSGSLERPLGLLAAAMGRTSEAESHFGAALVANRAAGSPLFAGRTLRDAGIALHDPERLTQALAAYRELGVAGRVAELEGLLGAAAQATAQAEEVRSGVFRREGDVWELSFAGKRASVKDVKGLRDIAALLAVPGRQVSAVELAGAPGAPHQRDLGDPLDDQARQAYKARLLELDAELAGADVAGDARRSARAQEERDAVLAQLVAAYGLGGRPRRVGDSGERARQAVSWRIRDALARIERVHPELADHLRHSLRTGAYCSYEPADAADWVL